MSASHHYVCQECNPSIASLFTHHRPTGVQPFHSFIASMHNLSPHPYTHPVSTLYPITTQPSTPYPPKYPAPHYHSTIHPIPTQYPTPHYHSTIHPIPTQYPTPHYSTIHPIPTQYHPPYYHSTIHCTPYPQTTNTITIHPPQHNTPWPTTYPSSPPPPPTCTHTPHTPPYPMSSFSPLVVNSSSASTTTQGELSEYHFPLKIL